MNLQLKLLASKLHAAGKGLSFAVGVANAQKKQDKARIEETEAHLSGLMEPALDLAMRTARQLRDLKTEEGEPRLADGAQTLLAALDEFAPVMAEADAWATAHKRDTWGVPPVVRVSNGILKLVFPNFVPAAKPLTKDERSQDTWRMPASMPISMRPSLQQSPRRAEMPLFTRIASSCMRRSSPS